MKSSFLVSLGLVGISSYPFGKEVKDLKGEEKTRLGTAWADQTGGEKVVTAITLPFRAVKRVVVAQTGISVGIVVGGIFGIVGATYAGLAGWMVAGSIVGGIVLGGLIGWGIAAFFGADHRTGKSYKEAAKAPVSDSAKPLFAAPIAAPAVDAAVGVALQAAA